MLCFSGGVNGVDRGITFNANAVNISEERLLLSRELKRSKDETAVKSSLFRLTNTVYRCALQLDANLKIATLLPPQPAQASPQKALILLDVPAEYLSFAPSRFQVSGGSEVIFTRVGTLYMGSSYADYSYLVVLEPGASITIAQKETDGSPCDVYTITFDGEKAFHSRNHQPAVLEA